MMKRSSKKSVNADAWLNTYADMVTLLLCFFVLLFAASTIDSEKWEILVRSLNPKAQQQTQIAQQETEGEPSNNFTTTGTALVTDIETFDQLYWSLKQYVETNNLSADVDILKGDGYTFIVFRNNVFFDGDQYYLRPEGKDILDFLSSAISSLSEDIAQIRIMGHTNQADPNKRNTPRTDWFLSSQRAAEVCAYIDEKGVIEPKKLTTEGKGQNYPAGSFVTEEDRQRNRRVEILISENEKLAITLDELYAEIENQLNLTDTTVEEGDIDLNIDQTSGEEGTGEVGETNGTGETSTETEIETGTEPPAEGDTPPTDIPPEDMVPIEE